MEERPDGKATSAWHFLHGLQAWRERRQTTLAAGLYRPRAARKVTKTPSSPLPWGTGESAPSITHIIPLTGNTSPRDCWAHATAGETEAQKTKAANPTNQINPSPPPTNPDSQCPLPSP